MNTEEIVKQIKKSYKANGKLPTVSQIVKFSGASNESVKKILKHYFSDDKYKNKSVTKRSVFVRIIMGSVGLSLVVCSVHFTYRFNNLGMENIWAFLLSFSMILFTSFAFTMADNVNEKTAKLIYVLWVIGVLYSIFTAIAGQYNDFRKYSAMDDLTYVAEQKEIYEDRLNEYNLKQSELLHWREKEQEYTENPDLKVSNPVTWKTIQLGVLELETVENKIENVQTDLLNLSKINTKSNKTIYTWLGSIFHINPDVIQFIIIVFPSVFLDLCAGVLLKFAFSNKKDY